jgi:tetratricopeptide (TPR) repeat protein
MALRLTGTSAAPKGPPTAAALAARARALLSADDFDGYHGLFARAAEHEDAQRRYQARLALLEEGLGATGQGAAARVTRLFAIVAQAGVEILEEEPREPIILNHAGIAFYELWSLDAAEALFKAAHRLDPDLPHLQRNLSELGRRRRSQRGPQGHLRPLHASLPPLVRRAKSIAAKAKPAENLTLSLCMIVRDEEEMLPRCLQAVAPAVDEIVIVDTGSVDRTIEIARSYGARVIEREWTGSFSDARNASFDAATSDWIIYLDADEVLIPEDAERLRALTGHVWREAMYLVETSFAGEEGDGSAMVNTAMRVFRNRPQYRFEGRLHEQIAHSLPLYAPGRLEQTSVRVEHYGYLGAVRNAKDKSRRNIELLREQEREGVSSPFQSFNLGTEYAVLGDHRTALAEFERAWEMAKRQGQADRDFMPTLFLRMVTGLQECGRLEEAIERAHEGQSLFPGFTDLVYAEGLVARELGRSEQATECWNRCLEMGDGPARYGSSIGAGTYLPMVQMAKDHAVRGELTEACDLLERCLAEHPRYPGSVLPYASLLLANGTDCDAVARQIEERVESASPSVHYMLGTAFFKRGAMEAAEQQFRHVVHSRPSNGLARVQLAETLLHLRRYAEAAAEAAKLEADAPFAALARRIELWGRLAAGDTNGAGTALATASARGLSNAEVELFGAWAALSGSDGPPHSLPVAATPLLGVILETLLRSRDFDQFEALLPLLEHSRLPVRERREALATMYLHHGFLPFAAKEWMAVCSEQPDARALVGLAQVALAHGTTEDAVTFAAEALRHDPVNSVAGAIVALHQAPPAAAEAAAQ